MITSFRMTADHIVEYESLIADISASRCEDPFQELVSSLEAEWLHFYKLMTPRVTNIAGYLVNEFEYVYDDYASLEKTGTVEISPFIESRVVYVHGKSRQVASKRNASRQKGWVGPTEKLLGANTDKGHFMAHSIGGGLEINVFVQDRSMNRGWSERGRVYRRMEKYCFENPGTYCFSRPIYSDLTSRPFAFDFGVLVSLTELWVERFENLIGPQPLPTNFSRRAR